MSSNCLSKASTSSTLVILSDKGIIRLLVLLTAILGGWIVLFVSASTIGTCRPCKCRRLACMRCRSPWTMTSRLATSATQFCLQRASDIESDVEQERTINRGTFEDVRLAKLSLWHWYSYCNQATCEENIHQSACILKHIHGMRPVTYKTGYWHSHTDIKEL